MWAVEIEAKRRPRRGAMVLTYDGATLPLHKWAERLGVPYETLRTRIHKVVNDRAERGLITNKLTTEEIAQVLRPRRLRRDEYLQRFGYVPPVRYTRPVVDDPLRSPYYDLTDQQFEALQAFARAQDVHMYYIRETMRDADLREDLKRVVESQTNYAN